MCYLTKYDIPLKIKMSSSFRWKPTYYSTGTNNIFVVKQFWDFFYFLFLTEYIICWTLDNRGLSSTFALLEIFQMKTYFSHQGLMGMSEGETLDQAIDNIFSNKDHDKSNSLSASEFFGDRRHDEL